MSAQANLQQIQDWVSTAVEDENLDNLEVKLVGKTKKFEGNMSDIVFMNVSGKRKADGTDVEFEVAVKINKDIKFMEKVDNVFKRETFLYREVFPMFRKFERSKGVKDVFDSVPKYYNTIEHGDKNIIVLENLKKRNFNLHDTSTFNVQHIRAILTEYAKFHAISFAIRDQNLKQFQELIGDYSSMHLSMLRSEFGDILEKATVLNYEVFSRYDPELALGFKKLVDRGAVKTLKEIYLDVPEECAITHGDCWSNNFMFQYKHGDKESPTKITIVDWQHSTLHSPTMDLGYFFFANLDVKQISNLDEHLKYYHDNISRHIRALGSDPEKLFPFDKFIRDWKRCSLQGFLYVMSCFNPTICGEARLLEEYESGKAMVESFFQKVDENARMDERLTHLARYFFKLNS